MPDIFKSIFDSISGPTTATYLISAGVALFCGIIVAFTASFRARISKSFMISLVILPVIIETVILMVNGNVGTGIAVAGAFSLVRFRSMPGRASEIAQIFLAMTGGLACSAGYIGVALTMTFLVCAVLLGLNAIPVKREREMDLKITVPESISFSGAFDEVFDEYTKSRRLVNVKTTNMGSLYKLSYKVELKNKDQMREFIDKLRCRNGNLEISCTEAAERSEEL